MENRNAASARLSGFRHRKYAHGRVLTSFTRPTVLAKVDLHAGVVHPWPGQIRLKRNGFKTKSTS
eukprot:scaffold51194_cov105-Phaeocystis_antarctica.AAC.1